VLLAVIAQKMAAIAERPTSIAEIPQLGTNNALLDNDVRLDSPILLDSNTRKPQRIAMHPVLHETRILCLISPHLFAFLQLIPCFFSSYRKTASW
jgi:hypothetical protein